MALANELFPNVILGLVGLGVLALLNYYYGEIQQPPPPSKIPSTRKACYCTKTPTSSSSITKEEKQKVEAEVDVSKEDYFSQLPDDVLSSILANLTVPEAARTSILSTRWKHLFVFMPTLKLRCLSMFGFLPFDHSCCHFCQEKLLKGVSQLLQLYSGRKVANIEFGFCLWRKFSSELNHWLRSISSLGVERLYLSFDCCAIYPIRKYNKSLKLFSLELLSQASSLKHLLLYYCIVLPSPEVRFNSLMTLTLGGVKLASGDLEGILSSCLNLQQLNVENCILPYKLRLASAVTTVVFWDCDEGGEIDLHAANLRTLVCWIPNYVRIFFSFVPVLEKVMVYPCGDGSISYIFGDFARDLPAQVKSLTIHSCNTELNHLPTEMKMFRNLRQLSLIFVYPCDPFDIIKLSSLLGVCPLLRYLSLVIDAMKVTTKDERGSRSPPTCHTELKEVAFGGFNGTGSEMEFVLYILRSAIVLERMILSPRYRYYIRSAWRTSWNVSFDERKRHSIQQKLHGQAIAREAVVIIQ